MAARPDHPDSDEVPDLQGLPTHLRPIRLLGTGGSAGVWLARDTRRGRDVALKILGLDRPSTAMPAAAGNGERLEQEVRALARLRDVPGVVAVHECGLTAEGVAWVATEHLPGGSLAELAGRSGAGGLDAAAAIELGAQLAETLAAIHAHGLAHGDLTPSNVLFDTQGRPRLVDLGLAWLEDGTAGGGCTPAFSPPERLRGAPASPAADVWSLAATLVSVIAGRPPAGGSAAAADVLAGTGLPDDVVRCLGDCLGERPSLRPDAGHVATVFRRAARPSDPEGGPVARIAQFARRFRRPAARVPGSRTAQRSARRPGG